MKIENPQQQDDVSVEIADLEAQFFGRPRAGQATEPWLWAYALGLLNLEEEQGVHTWLAGDPEAQVTLKRIRRSLVPEVGLDPTAAGAPLKTSVLAQRFASATAEAFRGVWEALALKPGEVVAVFWQKASGLEVRALQGTEVPLRPAYLSRGSSTLERGSAQSGEGHRKCVRLENGTEVSVLAEPGGSFRLILSLPNRALAGLVKVRRLVRRNSERIEEETGVQGRLEGGVATLKECPTGVLKIIPPAGRAFVLLLGHELPS